MTWGLYYWDCITFANKILTLAIDLSYEYDLLSFLRTFDLGYNLQCLQYLSYLPNQFTFTAICGPLL